MKKVITNAYRCYRARKKFCKLVGVKETTGEPEFTELFYADIIGQCPFLYLSRMDRVYLSEWLYVGRTYREIAKKFFVNESTVSRRISNAVKEIKNAIDSPQRKMVGFLTISQLNLDNACYNILRREHLEILRDLEACIKDGTPIKGIGPKRRKKIEKAIAEFNDFVRYMG